MTSSETETAIAEWEAGRARVTALVSSLDPGGLGRPVPACPNWTVHELLSHVVGLAVDVVGGQEADDHNDEWTQAHVDARHDVSTAAVIGEWEEVAPLLVAWMREHDTRPVGDLMIHEQDLRGALERPGARDTDGLAIVRESMVARLGEAVSKLPALALVATDGDWSWASEGEVADAAVVVEAPGFDLTRAVTSRRTADQLREWTVRGDVTPYLDAFASLGGLPEQRLPE